MRASVRQASLLPTVPPCTRGRTRGNSHVSCRAKSSRERTPSHYSRKMSEIAICKRLRLVLTRTRLPGCGGKDFDAIPSVLLGRIPGDIGLLKEIPTL